MADTKTLGILDCEKFKRHSKIEGYAKRGLGKAITAVDGFVELLTTTLNKAGIDADNFEVERWLDCYYQLRYEAEREADLARFVAEQMKNADKLEPIVPKLKCNIGPSVEDREEETEQVKVTAKGCISELDFEALSAAAKELAKVVKVSFMKVE